MNGKRIAITGGTGFVGRHLAALLAARGHKPVLIGRHRRERPAHEFHGIGLDDVDALTRAVSGCDAVAHLAGINREIGEQTYQRVHVDGTRNLVSAMRRADVERIAMLSFLRARARCGSAYHESKFAAEQIVRGSGLDYTILKSGVIYGRGDHLLDHTSRSLHTLPLFATVGLNQPPLRPTAVRAVAEILYAALVKARLENQTVYVVGPESLTMNQIVKRVADATGRRAWVFPLPVVLHRIIARMTECAMKVPLVSSAQVQMLVEGLSEPAPPCDELPNDLKPQTRFTMETIRAGLPDARGFGLSDLRVTACNREPV